MSSWPDRAYQSLMDYLARPAAAKVDRFMAEDVRDFAYAQGLPHAADPRAWGGVMGRAAKAGIIELTGYAPSKNPEAHKRPTAVWSVA